MKTGFFNDVERHVVFLLAGFVAMVSTVLMVSSIYVFMGVFTLLFGEYDVFFILALLGVAYYTGKKVMKGLD